MVINDREIGFKLTVGASAEIADFCPDGDITRIEEAFNGAYSKTVRNSCKVIRALNRGYVMSIDPLCKDHKVVTTEELLALDTDTFSALMAEAMKTFGVDMETTVEAEPKKEKTTEASETAEAD